MAAAPVRVCVRGAHESTRTRSTPQPVCGTPGAWWRLGDGRVPTGEQKAHAGWWDRPDTDAPRGVPARCCPRHSPGLRMRTRARVVAAQQRLLAAR